MFMIANRQIYLATGTNTQTINICAENGPRRGLYEFRYRIHDTSLFLSENAIQSLAFDSLESFVYFVKELGAIEEPTGDRLQAGVELLRPSDEMPADIIQTLDGCVNAFIDNFIANPYKHRCEHSVHVDLFNLLSSTPSINELHVQVGDSHRVPLVHKEWPEPRPIGDANRRGSHDIAVLRPCQTDIDHFRWGFIEPFAAFEVGLNYGIDHFDKDVFTLHHAKLSASYVIHLARAEAADQNLVVEKAQRHIAANHDGQNGWPKIAIAIFSKNGQRQRKYANKAEIETLSS